MTDAAAPAVQVVMNSELVTTEDDRELARAAMVEGWDSCGNRPDRASRTCDCNLGAIDGCRARVESIAKMIAFARKQ